jgi:ACR3 family arsenite transporter
MAHIQSQACSHAPNQEHDQPKLCDIEKQGDQIPPSEYQKKQSMFSSLGLLDRFLAVWIFLAMAIGIILGNFVPSTGPALEKGKFVGVSIPIGRFSPSPAYSNEANAISLPAVGLLVMMYPILCKIRFESLHHVFRTKDIWVQMAFSVLLNWIVAPFLMVRCIRRIKMI